MDDLIRRVRSYDVAIEERPEDDFFGEVWIDVEMDPIAEIWIEEDDIDLVVVPESHSRAA